MKNLPNITRLKDLTDKNILLIEDDLDSAESIWVTLTFAGFAARVAKNRDDGVKCIRQNIYHVILLDYFMDGMSAERFLAEVKVHSPISMVILMTAANQPERVARDLGIAHWIKKPVEPDAIADTIISLFSSAEAGQ